ncbi:MAG TPA: saccharopine dehydrogenase NADP-binding domain-containing protein [Xanthomonadales bacterium]|nr:saccharopine dehydrogenase NADP-binding domain-containing protein [Xanthomonadales bacterium]
MSDKKANWMIYGATGYTGRLMVEKAVADGMRPIVAGRNPELVTELASEHGLDSRTFELSDANATREGIRGCRLVLHCAGPFSVTSQPMIEACLAEQVHYLDITGEIPVFANAHRQSDDASRKDVLLIPGVGFDVVPSDCLAARLVEQLPAATHLTLAFDAAGGPSPGTAKTAAEGMSKGGCIRQDGKLMRVPAAWKTRRIPFAPGEREAVTIPWGDVYTAYVSTGVPNIQVYMAVPPARIKQMRRMKFLSPLMGIGFIQNFIRKRIEQNVSGPSAEKRAETRSELWGEAVSADGRKVSATMTAPNGYELTVIAGLAVTRYVLENDIEGGYYTPSLLMGADFAESLPGVSIQIHEV